MAYEFKWDTVEDSSAEQFGVIKRHARGALITGLPITGDPADLMWTVLELPESPRSGQTHPTRPEMAFTRALIRGVAGDGVRVQYIYETFNPYGAASAFYVSDESYVGAYETNMMPGTRRPLRCSHTDTESGLSIQEDFVPIAIDRAMRAISVTALIYGSPQGGNNADYTNFCNDGTWQGKPTAYWRLMRYKTSYSKYQGYFTREMQAVTKGNEDWSVFGVLRNSVTGRFAKIDQNIIDSVLDMEYQPFSIFPNSTSGFIRVCPYDVVDFELLFGF